MLGQKTAEYFNIALGLGSTDHIFWFSRFISDERSIENSIHVNSMKLFYLWNQLHKLMYERTVPLLFMTTVGLNDESVLSELKTLQWDCFTHLTYWFGILWQVTEISSMWNEMLNIIWTKMWFDVFVAPQLLTSNLADILI